ncbi:hypothetical protein [Butyrivibrio sp. MC2013]|uniref:hypothetical protein n=1 Tax=Butyrivibrio sp. MC2013 TaxID=1280686 RepID=UPI000409BC5F|nr:hypothetical protein [Butyrivibrio sp. MC2013]
MKKTIIKIIYVIVVFISSLIIINKLSNQPKTDRTGQMSEASLPTVSMLDENQRIGTLYGYTREMNPQTLRGNVFPAGAGREMKFVMDLYGQTADNLRFEVRSPKGNSLVESTQIEDYQKIGDSISCSIQVKDLIEAGREYMLVIIADVGDRPVRWYSRFVWTQDDDRYYFREKLDFVRKFSEMTFDKNHSSDLAVYMEPNSEGDNTTLAKVDIHSSISQLTWGNLNVTAHTEPEIYTLDLHDQTANILLKYQVTVNQDEHFNIEEYFRIRYTSDRIYLLGYERSMDHALFAEDSDYSQGQLFLSITDPNKIRLKESNGGSAVAFVVQDRLFALNMADSRLAYLFGFYDKDHTDKRYTLQNNEIEILNVDEGGNVLFSVAGYMNRGIHEGMVGVDVYRYDSATNTVEELVFVPSDMGEELVMASARCLTAAGSGNSFYTLIGTDLYSIDLLDRTYESVVSGMLSSNYEISSSGETIAWQDFAEDSGRKRIQIMNLGSQKISYVDADEGEMVILLGYMQDDLVYGVVRQSDVINDHMGNPVYAMYSIRIRDEEGHILEDYKPDPLYVTSAEMGDNQVMLERCSKNEESGYYEPALPDQIMSTLEEESGSNFVKTVAMDDYETAAVIFFKSEVKGIKYQNPSQIIYEGSREVDVKDDISSAYNYLVYDKGKVELITPDFAKALDLAYDRRGVIVDTEGSYIWYLGDQQLRNQNMSITRDVEKEDFSSEDSTQVCLRVMLEYEGINANVKQLMENGMTAEEILERNLPGARVLPADGCELEAMIYFADKDIPVLARKSDGSSVLIIGYNQQNIVLFDPSKPSDNVFKAGRKDTASMLSSAGNHFTTYIRN